MRTHEQIEKKIKKLERKLKLLIKYKDEVNFDVSNFRILAATCDMYDKDIRFVEGQLKAIRWMLDEDY